MGRYISVPILLIAVVLQSTVVPEIRIGNGGPDLVLMLVLSWAMLSGVEEGLVWAMAGGIMQDLINGTPTGTSALALVLIVLLVNVTVGVTARNNLISPPLVAILGTVVYHLIMLGLLAALGRGVPVGYALTYVTLPTVTFNAILMLPIYRLMGVLFEASRPRRVTL